MFLWNTGAAAPGTRAPRTHFIGHTFLFSACATVLLLAPLGLRVLGEEVAAIHLWHSFPQMPKGAILGPSFLEGTQPPKPSCGMHFTSKRKVVVFESRKTLELDSQSSKQSFTEHRPGSSLSCFLSFLVKSYSARLRTDRLCFPVSSSVHFIF